MKKNILYNFTAKGFLLSLVLFSACKYQQVEPSDYPDQKVYMSTASTAINGPGGSGIYFINSVAVPGQIYRYTVDQVNKKLNITLGVIRAGAYLDGDANIGITSSTDTLASLITSSKLTPDTQPLPSSSYTIATSAVVPGGSSSVTFPLIVDLNFLLNNPGKKYAVAISINSSNRAVNASLRTTVVLIDTQFLIPTATFTAAADPTSTKKINFNNTSLNGVSYSWDFGDGSALSSEKSPSHVYAASGSYLVKLTTTGATGDAQKVVSPPSSITVL